MRTNSQEGLKKRPVLTPTDSPVNQQKQPREELWHIDLRHNFLRQYIKYVQSLGFISVTLLPNLHSKGYILQGVLTSLSSINFKYYLVHVYLIIFYCYKESCIGWVHYIPDTYHIPDNFDQPISNHTWMFLCFVFYLYKVKDLYF